MQVNSTAPMPNRLARQRVNWVCLVAAGIAFSTLTRASAAERPAREWFVAPTTGEIDGGHLGAATGDGTQARPWEIQFALDGAAGKIEPGDTLWLRGGVYRSPKAPDSLTSRLRGQAERPIVVRNFENERVVIDGVGTGWSLFVESEYAWYWGLVFTDSSPHGIVTGCGGYCYNTRALGPAIYAEREAGRIVRQRPGNKFIHCVVHDLDSGFSCYNGTPETEFHGNVVFHNGYVGEDRPHGHGLYLQNNTGHKFVTNNIVFGNAVEGAQIYGSGEASVVGFRIHGNTLFDNSSWSGQQFQYNLMISGGGARKDIEVSRNCLYFTPERGQGYNAFGQYTLGDDMRVWRNVFVGGYQPLVVERQRRFEFTDNRVVCFAGGLFVAALQSPAEVDPANYAWDRNEYYDQSEHHFRSARIGPDDQVSGTAVDFATWRAATGFDAASRYSTEAPSGVWTYSNASDYEPGRAHVTIYNFDRLDSVKVDLRNSLDSRSRPVTILKPGERYAVHDAQNILGPPLVEGIYDDSGLISIPMNSRVKAKTNEGLDAGPHTDERFGVFVVRKSGS